MLGFWSGCIPGRLRVSERMCRTLPWEGVREGVPRSGRTDGLQQYKGALRKNQSTLYCCSSHSLFYSDRVSTSSAAAAAAVPGPIPPSLHVGRPDQGKSSTFEELRSFRAVTVLLRNVPRLERNLVPFEKVLPQLCRPLSS